MSLVAVRFDTAGAVADEWADALLAAGAISVDVADARAGTTLEAALDAASHRWEVARLTALFDPRTDIDAALARAGTSIGRTPGAHSLETVPESDWVRRTQAQFRPIRLSERLWIVPSWCNPVEHGPAVAATNLPGTHRKLLRRHTEDRLAAWAARVFLFSGHVHACGYRRAQPIRPPSPRDRY